MENKFLKGLVVSFAIAVSGIANAGLITINGNDFDSNSFISLPSGGYSESATSAQFTGLSNQIMFTFDLSAFGVGTSIGESLISKVTVSTTRLGVDSDLFFGITDGVNVDYFGLYDADRLYENNTDGLLTGNAINCCGNFVSSFLSIQETNQELISIIDIDLGSMSIGYSAAGISGNHSINPLFNYDNNLSFFIAMNTPNERHQINYLSVQSATQSIPEPSTLAIFALSIIGLASRKFKKQA